MVQELLDERSYTRTRESIDAFQEIRSLNKWRRNLAALTLAGATLSGVYLTNRGMVTNKLTADIRQCDHEARALNSEQHMSGFEGDKEPYSEAHRRQVEDLQQQLAEIAEKKQKLEEQLPGLGRFLLDAGATVLPLFCLALVTLIIHAGINREKYIISNRHDDSFEKMQSDFKEQLEVLQCAESKNIGDLVTIALKEIADKNKLPAGRSSR